MGLFSKVGGELNSITGASGSASSAYKYSAALAAQNWAYQKEMAQNAHQWEVEDLKKAGLNPALSGLGGTGASAGGAGGGGTVGTTAGGGAFSEIMNSAKGLVALASELENLNADTQNKRETNRLIGAQSSKTEQEIQKVNTETQMNIAETKKIASETMLNSAQTAFTKRRASGKGGSISAKGISAYW